MPFGLIFENPAFWFLGLGFMLAGIINKDKWKKNRKTWKKLTNEEKKLHQIILIILSVMVLAGLVFFYISVKGII